MWLTLWTVIYTQGVAAWATDGVFDLAGEHWDKVHARFAVHQLWMMMKVTGCFKRSSLPQSSPSQIFKAVGDTAYEMADFSVNVMTSSSQPMCVGVYGAV